jgi:hypothetical protein
MGPKRWLDDLLRLLVASAFLIAAKALLGELPLLDAARIGAGVLLLLLGILLVLECVTRWLGVRTGGRPSGPPKTGSTM